MLKFKIDSKAWDPNETVRFDAAAEEYRRLCQGMPEDLPQTDMDGSAFDPYWPLAKSLAQQYHVRADLLFGEAPTADEYGLENAPDVPDSEF